jgi:hypothetical protein
MIKAMPVALAASALFLAAGCITTRGSPTSSAERLEHNADALARDAGTVPAGADYSTAFARDARQLADDTHAFRRVAEDRTTHDEDVRMAFKRVSQDYHQLRDDVDRTDSREVHADLKPVTDAYLDVEREMGGYPVRHASATDRY